jgi:hypothetical protein
VSLARAFDLEVADRTLRVNRCKSSIDSVAVRDLCFGYQFLREVAYDLCKQERQNERKGNCGSYQPTFDEASVKLLRVVDLPDEGFPTKPIKGSRGILS